MKLDAIELSEDFPRRMSGLGAISEIRAILTEFFDDSGHNGEGHGSLMRKPPIRLVSNFYFDVVNSLTRYSRRLDWKTLMNKTQLQINIQKRLERQQREEEEEEEEEEDEETKNKLRLARIIARCWSKPISFKNKFIFKEE